MPTSKRIYKVENKLTGKCYVGQTGQSLRRRFQALIDGHSQPITKAIKQVGRSHFVIELLEEVSTDMGDAAERKWIEQLNSYEPGGYNVREGGIHGRLAESTKVKLRNREISAETRAKQSSARKGKRVSEKALRSLALGRAARWTPALKMAASCEGNPRARLTKEQVIEIRSSYAKGTFTQQQLAEMYDVKQVTISAILTGKTWRLPH